MSILPPLAIPRVKPQRRAASAKTCAVLFAHVGQKKKCRAGKNLRPHGQSIRIAFCEVSKQTKLWMGQKKWKKSAQLASFETKIHEALDEEMVQARRQLFPACLVILWRSNAHNAADAASLIPVIAKIYRRYSNSLRHR